MGSPRKFYRTVYKFELLTEDPPNMLNIDHTELSLSDLEYHATEGHASGLFLDKTTEEITGATAARLLTQQGSDPEFFCLTPEGEDTDEAWTFDI